MACFIVIVWLHDIFALCHLTLFKPIQSTKQTSNKSQNDEPEGSSLNILFRLNKRCQLISAYLTVKFDPIPLRSDWNAFEENRILMDFGKTKHAPNLPNLAKVFPLKSYQNRGRYWVYNSECCFLLTLVNAKPMDFFCQPRLPLGCIRCQQQPKFATQQKRVPSIRAQWILTSTRDGPFWHVAWVS